MIVINARNVNDAYQQGVDLFRTDDTLWKLPSRAGNVIEMDCPVTTVFTSPKERVLWDSLRDCNPFFHLFESLWMMAGRNDVEYLTRFNKKMASFGEGDVYHGAYGFRWRHWFGFDQLKECIKLLREDRMTRRCVMTMWSPNGDLIAADGGTGGMSSLDLPCNLMIKFEARKSRLDMIVYNRSNDMIWGAYGANAVHMSMLQELVAACANLEIGSYWQVSGNFHVYENVWSEKVRADGSVDPDLYKSYAAGNGRVHVTPFVPVNADSEFVLHQIGRFVSSDGKDLYLLPFLNDVAAPLYQVWSLWKTDRAKALMAVQSIHDQSNDWVTACRMWMERRIQK